MTRYAEARISNPSRFYETPEVVLSDDKLSQEEKVKVLQSMVDDADQLMDATAEGMESRKGIPNRYWTSCLSFSALRMRVTSG